MVAAVSNADKSEFVRSLGGDEVVRQGHAGPHVFARIPLAEAGRAHEIMESRRNLGKVVLMPQGRGRLGEGTGRRAHTGGRRGRR